MIVRCISCGVPVPDGINLPNNECYCKDCKGKMDLKIYPRPKK